MFFCLEEVRTGVRASEREGEKEEEGRRRGGSSPQQTKGGFDREKFLKIKKSRTLRELLLPYSSISRFVSSFSNDVRPRVLPRLGRAPHRRRQAVIAVAARESHILFETGESRR
jgi:hypothetical protein